MTSRILSVITVLSMLAGACASPGRGVYTPPTGGAGDSAQGGGVDPTAESYAPKASRYRGPAVRTERTAGYGGSATTPPPAPGHGPAARPSPSRGHNLDAPPRDYRRDGSRQRIVTPQPTERPGLGTVFGERMASRVNYTSFQRASNRPAGIVSIHYNDHQGLMAMARHLRRTCCGAIPAYRVGGGLSVQLVDPYRRPLSGLQLAGRTLVMGAHGQRYGILVRNHTGQRWEIGASVDGLDVIDGRRAGFQKRGYVLAPYGTLFIQGFRTSAHTVAAFRFGSVRNSYAARTGSDRNVGVVGIAAFAEYRPPVVDGEVIRRLRAQPFGPGYAQPPRY